MLDILHEDDELLVLNKPQDLVCHPGKDGPLSCLVGRVRHYLPEGHPGHLLNRLDRETSGIVMVAKKDDAARELRRLWEAHKVTKTYTAIVHGWPQQDGGVIDAPLGKDTNSIIAIKDTVVPGGAVSRTHWRVLQSFDNQYGKFSHLKVQPESGRKHQIRIHLSHIGHSIVGDKLYGADEGIYLAFVERRMTPELWAQLILPNHALHAGRLEFTWRRKEWVFECPAPTEFQEFGGLRS